MEYAFNIHDLWVRKDENGKLMEDYYWTVLLRSATNEPKIETVTMQHKACHALPSDADLQAQKDNPGVELKLPRSFKSVLLLFVNDGSPAMESTRMSFENLRRLARIVGLTIRAEDEHYGVMEREQVLEICRKFAEHEDRRQDRSVDIYVSSHGNCEPSSTSPFFKVHNPSSTPGKERVYDNEVVDIFAHSKHGDPLWGVEIFFYFAHCFGAKDDEIYLTPGGSDASTFPREADDERKPLVDKIARRERSEHLVASSNRIHILNSNFVGYKGKTHLRSGHFLFNAQVRAMLERTDQPTILHQSE
ncbi:hypothetical protein AAVH_36702, partial [Aphelenchoides avenae]